MATTAEYRSSFRLKKSMKLLRKFFGYNFHGQFVTLFSIHFCHPSKIKISDGVNMRKGVHI